jgi:hypothetical protein
MALTRLITKVRDLIHDDTEPSYYTEVYNTDKTFTLPDASIVSSTLQVYQNNVLLVNTSGHVEYTIDITVPSVTIESTVTLGQGDVISFRYSCYKQYTDAEIKQYIHSSIIRLSCEKYTTFVLRDDEVIFPTPVEQDENLICLIASILMEGNLARYKTPDIELEFAKDEDNESRIKRTIRMFRKTFGVVDYMNLRRPYTIYVEDSDMTLENLP